MNSVSPIIGHSEKTKRFAHPRATESLTDLTGRSLVKTAHSAFREEGR